MKHSDFKTGMRFSSATGIWVCTDVGVRTAIAIKENLEDPSWMNGPPYAVCEHVFDEYDFPGLHVVKE